MKGFSERQARQHKFKARLDRAEVVTIATQPVHEGHGFDTMGPRAPADVDNAVDCLGDQLVRDPYSALADELFKP